MGATLTGLAVQGVGVALNLLVATIGVRAAKEMLTGMMAQMVKDQRGPSMAELEALISGLEARSTRIQGS